VDKGLSLLEYKIVLLYERIRAAESYLQLAANLDVAERPLLRRDVRELAKRVRELAQRTLELADRRQTHRRRSNATA
jgi:gamma-glutamylcysteine synthetase